MGIVVACDRKYILYAHAFFTIQKINNVHVSHPSHHVRACLLICLRIIYGKRLLLVSEQDPRHGAHDTVLKSSIPAVRLATSWELKGFCYHAKNCANNFEGDLEPFHWDATGVVMQGS